MENCYANWPLLLEYLKVLLSWPPVSLVLALVLVPTFGQPLKDVFKRVRRGKAAGIEFEWIRSKRPRLCLLWTRVIT
jgi:hypothetical protein